MPARGPERGRMNAFHEDPDSGPRPDPNPSARPPMVGVVMGSTSDWEILRHAASKLSELGVPWEARVLSAHRTPDRLFAWAEAAAGRGILAVIAGAGGAAHLPGMLAAKTLLPVLGVPVPSGSLAGMDSLLSIVQMPAGVPVGTLAIGRAGAVNAALLATAIVAVRHEWAGVALRRHREALSASVPLEPEGAVGL
jgi:5-(carboxyamino)imidazole ribonucleotide mutase